MCLLPLSLSTKIKVPQKEWSCWSFPKETCTVCLCACIYVCAFKCKESQEKGAPKLGIRKYNLQIKLSFNLTRSEVTSQPNELYSKGDETLQGETRQSNGSIFIRA
jgi:hypothetical protein